MNAFNDVLVNWILRKYGYPPDRREKATQTVLEQAEFLSDGWEDWPGLAAPCRDEFLAPAIK